MYANVWGRRRRDAWIKYHFSTECFIQNVIKKNVRQRECKSHSNSPFEAWRTFFSFCQQFSLSRHTEHVHIRSFTFAFQGCHWSWLRRKDSGMHWVAVGGAQQLCMSLVSFMNYISITKSAFQISSTPCAEQQHSKTLERFLTHEKIRIYGECEFAESLNSVCHLFYSASLSTELPSSWSQTIMWFFYDASIMNTQEVQ